MLSRYAPTVSSVDRPASIAFRPRSQHLGQYRARHAVSGLREYFPFTFSPHPFAAQVFGPLLIRGAPCWASSQVCTSLSGVRPVAQGSVTFDGQDITTMPPHERVKLGICQAPEGRGIFPGMTVLENLEMGTYTRKSKDAKQAEELEHVFELFPRLKERISQPEIGRAHV